MSYTEPTVEQIDEILQKAWKAFHDQFLSYGGPPIPLVRQQMMGGKAEAVF